MSSPVPVNEPQRLVALPASMGIGPLRAHMVSTTPIVLNYLEERWARRPPVKDESQS
jgi:hypothetical protein